MGEEAKAEEQKDLSEEEIRNLKGDTRAQLCAVELNAILKKYYCIYNPVASFNNHGYRIEVKLVALAYPAPTTAPGFETFIPET